MKRKRSIKKVKVQAALSRDPNAKPEVSPLEDVIEITANTCEQKDICQCCERGDRYGMDLHFLLHYLDGSIRTVCYKCGRTAAGKNGLRLPRTESDIFAAEEEVDLRLIRIARAKMEAKNV